MRVEHIGNATLVLADCMDVMHDMPDKAFELAIIDPPGAEYFAELERVSKNRIIWGANYFDLPPMMLFLGQAETGIKEMYKGGVL